jgi:hypothetical protein
MNDIKQPAENRRMGAVLVVEHGAVALGFDPQHSKVAAVVDNARAVTLGVELAGDDRRGTGDLHRSAANVLDEHAPARRFPIQQ